MDKTFFLCGYGEGEEEMICRKVNLRKDLTDEKKSKFIEDLWSSKKPTSSRRPEDMEGQKPTSRRLKADDMVMYEGKTANIGGMTCKFFIDHDLGGDLHAFDCGDDRVILATVDYDDIRGVPVQLNEDGEMIDSDNYYGDVSDWNHYVKIVDSIITPILKDKGKFGISLDEIQEYVASKNNNRR